MRRTTIGLLVAGAFLLVHGLWAQGMGIAPDEYAKRRARLLEKMEPKSVAVFRASDPVRRNGDVDFKYRQNSHFLYLTGCNESGATLLLVPGGIAVDSVTTVREVLFVRPATPQWTGDMLGIEGAKRDLGIGAPGSSSAVLPSDKLAEILERTLKSATTLYYTHVLPEAVVDPVSGKRFVAAREIRNELNQKYPDLQLRSMNSALGEMRSIKSPAELSLLQKAIDATVTAVIEAMKSAEPGMYEYELQAVVEYCFARAGAEYTGYPSIIGSGPNSQILHYEANRRRTEEGDVIVMDVGAEYHGYSADVTRTMAVSGTFTAPQREIYEIVLAAADSATAEMKVGASGSAPSRKAFDVLASGLLRLGIIKDAKEVNRYCPHGVSHFIGLEVHDVGPMIPVYQPGMVLTMEPGLYIQAGSPCDKKYWNIGVRIEDDVLITPDGPKRLSAGAPRTVQEIEGVMRLKGVGNVPVGSRTSGPE